MSMRSLGFVIVLGAAVAAQANVLVNSGFESDISPTDWSTVWGGASREEWNTPPEGKYAFYIKGKWGGQDNGGVIQSVPAAEGNRYALRAMIYCDNGWKAVVQVLKLEFFDSDGNLLDTFSQDLAGLVEKRWTETTVTGAAPAGTARAQVVLEVSGVGNDGLIGIDNVNLDVAKN